MSVLQGPEGIGPRDEVDELFDAARALADRPVGDDRVDWQVVRLRVRRRRALRTAGWALSTAVLAGAAVWLVRGWTGGATPGTGPSAVPPAASAPAAPGATEYRLLLPEPRVRVVADRAAELEVVSAAEVELRAGTVRVAVDASGGPVPFVVRTPAARIEVLGTRFGVRHDAGGTSVAVLEGRVRVATAAGVERIVDAGGEWPAGDEPRLLGAPWRAELVRVLGAAGASGGATGSEEPRLATAVPALPPPEPPSPPRTATGSSPIVGPSAVAASASSGEPAGGPGADPAPEPSGELLYRQAEAAMTAGRLEEAVALLERVAELERGRALGGTALIDLAARYRRLGRPADAAAACRRYLAEHPGGTFRGEARITLCRLEQQAGNAAAARVCYAAYLEEQPAGPYAVEAAAGAAGSGNGT